MKLKKLSLVAFGQFSGEDIDFDEVGRDQPVHVVFGPNEAGKSTSLRAVRCLFFGIPIRTQDAYLHPAQRLEIAGEVEHEGHVVSLRRVKRKKDNLLGPSDEPLPESWLAEILGHVDERTFSTRIGIDQDELERGAQALLGGAEQGLFAAGTAGSWVKRTLERLEQERGELFLSRGRLPKLNRETQRLQESQKRFLQAICPPDKWLEQKRAEEQAQAEAEELRRRRTSLRAEHMEKSRFASLLPELSTYRRCMQDLSELAEVRPLPPEAAELRKQHEQARRDAEVEIGLLSARISELGLERDLLGEPDRLANLEQEALDFKRRIGWEFKAREDRPKLEARLQVGLARIRDLLGRILGSEPSGDILERAKQLLEAESEQRRLRRHLNECVKRQGEVLQLTQRRDEMELECLRLSQQYSFGLGLAQDAAPRSETADALSRRIEVLQETVLTLREIGRKVLSARERGLDEARFLAQEGVLGRELSAVQQEVRALLGEYGETFFDSAELIDGSVLSGVERAMQRLDETLLVVRSRYQKVKEEEGLLEVDLKRLSERPGFVSPEEVISIRAERDSALARWISSWQAAVAPTRPSDEELWSKVRLADAKADGALAQAQIIFEREDLLRRIDRCRREAELLLEREANCQKEYDEVFSRLSARFGESERTGLLGLPFPVLRRAYELLAKQRELLGARAALVQTKGQLAEELSILSKKLQQAALALDPRLAVRGLPKAEAKGLEALAQTVESMVARTSTELHELEQVSLSLRSLMAEREVVAQKLRRVAADAGCSESEVRRCLESLGLRSSMPLVDIEDALVSLSALGQVFEEVRDKKSRIAGILRDSSRLEQELTSVLSSHASDLIGKDLIEATSELVARVERARHTHEARLKLEEDQKAERRKLHELKVRSQRASAAIQELCVAAGVVDEKELPRAEQRAERYRELTVERERAFRSLSEKAPGVSTDLLLARADGTSYPALMTAISELEDEIQQMDERVSNAEARTHALQQGLARYEALDAHVQMQEGEIIRAEVQTLLRRYLTVSLAQRVLQREMTAYAEENAAPLLVRASQLFSELTLGRYERLTVPLGENQILVRRGSEELSVSDLSRGARAQLYLALRVASLEVFFERNRKIPVVFDDLLADFDDERAEAAFGVLGQLSRVTQVICFTHLARDLSAAQAALGDNRVSLHRLGARVH